MTGRDREPARATPDLARAGRHTHRWQVFGLAGTRRITPAVLLAVASQAVRPSAR
ncbi:hypothetical protein BC739_008025 [Kutzneria viridogrisea]|uniref:Uncharacterized protein n=1 Tax=Kutzneria viridogrisea TaxID=47990 RepID=A0ABR6BV37_9PSEU|nr:hypothetical protein [Kutzneria viridogrisea]